MSLRKLLDVVVVVGGRPFAIAENGGKKINNATIQVNTTDTHREDYGPFVVVVRSASRNAENIRAHTYLSRTGR